MCKTKLKPFVTYQRKGNPQRPQGRAPSPCGRETQSLPVIPPIAPATAIRALASSCVVHASAVPALLTSGSAKHRVVAAQPMLTNVPPTHIANAPSMQAWSPSVHEAEVVREANWELSFWAERAFWSWKFDEEEDDEDDDDVDVEVEAAAEVVVTAASVVFAAASVVVAGAAAVDELSLSSSSSSSPQSDSLGMFSRPGSCVTSVSCVPSAMGPAGFAGQSPKGESGAERPKGIVPAAPSARPPTNVCWSAPWNWHWKRPASSAFFGADWQYGTATELGYAMRTINESSEREGGGRMS